MVIKNQNFDSINWMVNFKKVHNYINSDKFVEDLLYNQYDFNKDQNNYIYVDLERGIVVDRAIPGNTLKTVKITCGNISELGMTNPTSINSIAGTRERFNKFSKEFLFNRSCPNWVNNAPDRIKRLTTGSLPWFVFNKEECRDIIKYLSVQLVYDRCYLGKVKVDRIVDLNNFSITNSDGSLTEIFREELSTYSISDLDKMCDRFSNHKAKLVSLEDEITKEIVKGSLYFGLDKVPDYNQLKEMYYNDYSFNVFYEEILFPAYKIYSKNNMNYSKDLDLYIKNATAAIFEYLKRFVCEDHFGSEYFLRDMFLKYPNILMEIILKDSKDIFENNLNKFINSETCKISLLRHGGNLPVYVDLKEDDHTKYHHL